MRKMKIWGKDPTWIILLAGSVALVVQSIYLSIQHRSAVLFLVMGFPFLILSATIYWIDWIVRRNVTNFEVCMVIGGCAAAADFWIKGVYAVAVAIAGLTLYGAFVLIRRLFRKVDPDQQMANLNAYRAEANSLSPIKRNLISLSFFVIAGALLWAFNGFTVPEYARFLFIVAGWEACMLIYHIVTDNRSKTKGNPAVESATESGDPA